VWESRSLPALFNEGRDEFVISAFSFSGRGVKIVHPFAGASPMNEPLLRAIREKRLIAFSYKGSARRTAEPHDYGIFHGRETLLAYQLSGASSSGAARGWKDLHVDDLARLELLERTFPGSRGHETKLRHRDWDVLFARVD
jgi:hypothetical protein